ncbi:DNA-protecting protein DprA [Streptomyces sp. NBC_01619]|uniref:DNA-processing protein DprA n=1 Tax=Streptomyces sp. NBC_01619 TaxID=2975901 RepID=UPI00224D0B2D|nr:DNA-processing protein DprA [Streptomyces sp. NBC_01619]MCX4515906.1 DNA-protecting protein DprA [Streptomyces sp. NBC_01619]
MNSPAFSERAARAALAAFRSPESVSAGLAEHGAEEVWQRLAAADHTGRLAGYRPGPELSAAQLVARFVIPGDPEWPAALDALGDARPFGVWVRGRGELAAFSARAVTVTGRRVASAAGAHQAQQVARELSMAGHTIASPLSYGIDTAAQDGAHSEAPTLAVLPCGLDSCHPHHQADLLDRVLSRGGVAVSAHRPGTAATRDTLAMSGQLLAALSAAVVLVEPAPDVSTVPLEAALAARQLRRPVFLLRTGDPSASIPQTRRVTRLMETVQPRPADSAADILTELT